MHGINRKGSVPRFSAATRRGRRPITGLPFAAKYSLLRRRRESKGQQNTVGVRDPPQACRWLRDLAAPRRVPPNLQGFPRSRIQSRPIRACPDCSPVSQPSCAEHYPPKSAASPRLQLQRNARESPTSRTSDAGLVTLAPRCQRAANMPRELEPSPATSGRAFREPVLRTPTCEAPRTPTAAACLHRRDLPLQSATRFG